MKDKYIMDVINFVHHRFGHNRFCGLWMCINKKKWRDKNEENNIIDFCDTFCA